MVWENIKNDLRQQLPANEFDLWIKPLVCLENRAKKITLAAETGFFAQWVSEKYLSRINTMLKEMGRSEIKLEIMATAEKKNTTPGQLALPAIASGESVVRTLHPRFTFDEFMIGESNAMARTACGAIASGDTAMGQTVYLRSGHGLGKSHLTQAVAHHILKNGKGEAIVYRSAHQFTADMVKSIHSGNMETFNRTYQDCDLLLIENIPALTGRKKSQEVIIQAIDSLTERGKRIIYTGNISPVEIEGIDPELQSRLSCALLATINPPDHRTRSHIVRRKANNCGLKLSDDIIELLSRDLTGDIRRIESAITTIKARTILEKKNPDLTIVETILRDILGNQRQLSAVAIRDFVARQFMISPERLQSRSRKKEVSLPRQIGMYLARKNTDEGLAGIGRAFNRDHSTVVHAVRAVSNHIRRNTSIRRQVELMDQKITRGNL